MVALASAWRVLAFTATDNGAVLLPLDVIRCECARVGIHTNLHSALLPIMCVDSNLSPWGGNNDNGLENEPQLIDSNDLSSIPLTISAH